MIELLLESYKRILTTQASWSTMRLVFASAMRLGALISDGRKRLFSILGVMVVSYALLELVRYRYLSSLGFPNNAAGSIAIASLVAFFVGGGFAVGYVILHLANRANKRDVIKEPKC